MCHVPGPREEQERGKLGKRGKWGGGKRDGREVFVRRYTYEVQEAEKMRKSITEVFPSDT